MTASVLILVPIYKDELDAAEQFSLDHSLKVLTGREVRFIAPQSMDGSYYLARYPGLPIERFAPPCFDSIPEYNRLLLDVDFYARYDTFEFILILQTDAIVLRDELDYWCDQPFDYIGAPWPKAYELFVNAGRFEGEFGKHVHVHVGNGGLSLRRIQKCKALLTEFPVECGLFRNTGSSEDLYFSVMGALSNSFVMPNEITASRFSIEGLPAYYFRVNGECLPMGGHAWLKNDVDFWLRLVPEALHAIGTLSQRITN
jgi:hypothetical protein